MKKKRKIKKILIIIFFFSENKDLKYELKPNIKNYNFLGTKININSDGFRDKEYPKNKESKIYRVASLGDSNTFGLGVNLEDTYSKVLEKYLNNLSNTKKFEIMNFGVPGYHITQQFVLIKNKINKYNPDLLIIYLPSDEFERKPNLEKIKVPKSSKFYIIRLFAEKLDFLIKKEPLERFNTIPEYHNYIEKQINSNSANFIETRNQINQIREFFEPHKRVIFIFVPPLNKEYLQNQKSEEVNLKFYAILDYDQNIVQNTFDIFKDSEFILKDNKILTKKAHTLLAQRLVALFSTINILDTNAVFLNNELIILS